MSLIAEIQMRIIKLQKSNFTPKLITLSEEGAFLLEKEISSREFYLHQDEYKYEIKTLLGLPIAFKLMDEEFLIGV